ncbi:hypothetical protein N779_25680 [Vibrio coralliilyticus OCN008]|nr:hypothetical protein N779_25680 [Vibrio coralliilyticus OCN008]
MVLPWVDKFVDRDFIPIKNATNNEWALIRTILAIRL